MKNETKFSIVNGLLIMLLIIFEHTGILRFELLLSYEWHKIFHLFGVALFLGNMVIGPVWFFYAFYSNNSTLLRFAEKMLRLTDVYITAIGFDLAIINGLFLASNFGGSSEEPWLKHSVYLLFIMFLCSFLLLGIQEKIYKIIAIEPINYSLLKKWLWRWSAWGSIVMIPPTIIYNTQNNNQKKFLLKNLFPKNSDYFKDLLSVELSLPPYNLHRDELKALGLSPLVSYKNDTSRDDKTYVLKINEAGKHQLFFYKNKTSTLSPAKYFCRDKKITQRFVHKGDWCFRYNSTSRPYGKGAAQICFDPKKNEGYDSYDKVGFARGFSEDNYHCNYNWLTEGLMHIFKEKDHFLDKFNKLKQETTLQVNQKVHSAARSMSGTTKTAVKRTFSHRVYLQTPLFHSVRLLY